MAQPEFEEIMKLQAALIEQANEFSRASVSDPSRLPAIMRKQLELEQKRSTDRIAELEQRQQEFAERMKAELQEERARLKRIETELGRLR